LFARKTSVNCLSLSRVEVYCVLVGSHYIVEVADSERTIRPLKGYKKLHIEASQYSPVKHYGVCTSTGKLIAEKTLYF